MTSCHRGRTVGLSPIIRPYKKKVQVDGKVDKTTFGECNGTSSPSISLLHIVIFQKACFIRKLKTAHYKGPSHGPTIDPSTEQSPAEPTAVYQTNTSKINNTLLPWLCFLERCTCQRRIACSCRTQLPSCLDCSIIFCGER